MAPDEVDLPQGHHNQIAKTASRTITMTDWTRSLKRAPAMLTTATASTTLPRRQQRRFTD
jgi:hypothetical protein